MRIYRVEEHPFHSLRCQVVEQGTRAIRDHAIPFMRAECDSLPVGLEAIVFMSDLQARVPKHGSAQPGQLAGEVVAEELELLAQLGEIPPSGGIGVVILGDMFARPGLDRRGGNGDVRSVWEAFRTRFRWVAGVAGNHDQFGESPREFREFIGRPRRFFLDNNCVRIDALQVAGVSGVVGERERPFRRRHGQFLTSVKQVLSAGPDLLALHIGPPKHDVDGVAGIEELLNHSGSPLTAFGHKRWPIVVEDLPGGGQLLNAEGRVIVVSPASSDRGIGFWGQRIEAASIIRKETKP